MIRSFLATLAALTPTVVLAQYSPPPQQDPQAAPAPAPAPQAQPAPAPQAPAPYPAAPAPAQAAPPAYPWQQPPPQYPQQMPPRQQRDSWYIGFGIGGGGGDIRVNGTTYSFKDFMGGGGDAVSMNFRVGWTASPNLLLGFDTGFLAGTGPSGTNDTVQLSHYDVGMMWFPMERGFYVRAAAGLSSIHIDTSGPVLLGTGDFRGWNAIGGVGYAFWLGRTFNLTLNLDYEVQGYGSNNVDVQGASGVSGWIGFDWY
jgi:hypothetical protein